MSSLDHQFLFSMEDADGCRVFALAETIPDRDLRYLVHDAAMDPGAVVEKAGGCPFVRTDSAIIAYEVLRARFDGDPIVVAPEIAGELEGLITVPWNADYAAVFGVYNDLLCRADDPINEIDNAFTADLYRSWYTLSRVAPGPLQTLVDRETVSLEVGEPFSLWDARGQALGRAFDIFVAADPMQRRFRFAVNDAMMRAIFRGESGGVRAELSCEHTGRNTALAERVFGRPIPRLICCDERGPVRPNTFFVAGISMALQGMALLLGADHVPNPPSVRFTSRFGQIERTAGVALGSRQDAAALRHRLLVAK